MAVMIFLYHLKIKKKIQNVIAVAHCYSVYIKKSEN